MASVQKERWLRLLTNERGATMIEYAILAATISVVAIAILLVIGTNLTQVYTTVSGALVPAP